MLMAVCCQQCGGECSYKFGTFVYSVEIHRSEQPCVTCHHSRENKHDYSFCSLACMKLFVQTLDEHQQEFPAYWATKTGPHSWMFSAGTQQKHVDH